MMSKYSPEQMQQFRQFANSFGVTNEQLDKYGINSKKSWYKYTERRMINEWYKWNNSYNRAGY